MNYLSVEHISKSFGERILFENISFGINSDQKIGFIAKNGTGKTTLLKIIAGEESPDSGNIVFRKQLKVSYLSQREQLDDSLTIEESILRSDNEVLGVINRYELALQNPDNTDAYQLAFDEMERANAWDFETRYKQILFKLQLKDLSQKVGNLSGGQKKRLALALVLLESPELLILDEPTNHLDLEMIEWLEDYLKSENAALFMVTHDRFFLDRVCNEIIELDQGELFRYKGNYAYFLEKKEERLQVERTTLSKAKSLYRKELDWMRRQPKARTTKSKSRIDDFFAIKQLAHQRRKEHTVQLQIQMERLGSKIVELHKVTKGFSEKVLIDKFDYVFKRGERIGIIGPNGSGKSTMVNLITGLLPSDTGKVVVGDTIKFGYYSQAGISVKSGQKVIEVIREFGDYIPLTKGKTISAAQLLERFLFDRKKQYDYVEKLSGGELKRLFLCTVLIQNPNFLILDEPTNDLDIITLQVLEQFLLDFPGNILVVSHDRYFMDRLVDHLFVFEGNGQISDFPGNYSDYRIYDDSRLPEAKETRKKEDSRKAAAQPGQLSYQEKREFGKLEKDIENLQKKKIQLELQFSQEDLDQEAIEVKSKELEEILASIEIKEERWLELSLKME